MFAVVVTLSLKSGTAKQFLSLLAVNAKTSLATEAGCHQFDIATDPDRPDEVLLYELYKDLTAFEAHMQTAHFNTFDAATADMIVGKDVKTYRTVRQ